MKLFLMIIGMLLGSMSFSQGYSGDEFIVKGKSSPKGHLHISVINNLSNDTIQSICATKNFRLNPLDIHNSYTILFQKNGHIKTFYFAAEDSDQAMATYFIYLEIVWDDWDTYGSIEYDKEMDTFIYYESQALKYESINR